MNRGDVFLLVGYLVLVLLGALVWEISTPTTILALVIGGAVFAVRLYLARRTFR